jgi:hypothetical protein
MGSSLVGLFLKENKSEFKDASELDDTTIKYIQNEFFKKTFVVPFIVVVISVAVFALWAFEIIPKVFGPSDLYDTVVFILVPLSGAFATTLNIRCIFSLIIVSKIRKKKFLWYLGFIRGKNWRYPVAFSKMHKYYSVDDKYFALLSVNPIYKKGTPVYFLYFPKGANIGGAVVRYEE